MTAPLRVRAARLVVVALLLAAGLAAMPGTATAATGADEVHYTFTSATSVAIDWRGDPQDVRWGPTSSYGQTGTGTDPAWKPWSSAGPFRQLELGGLAPGTTYHYSIGGGPDYTFHTPPTGDFRFDAIGDVGETVNFSKLGDTLDRIAADDPSFVLMVGDLTYANAPNSGQTAVDQHFNDVMRWSTSAAYMPAWGNHEYDVAGADDLRNYKGRLMMPHAQASPGSPDLSCCGNDWGWFDAGPVRFIAYPEPWTGAWADWQSKANTLMNQAQNDPSVKYIITYGHRPAYSTGYHPGEAQLANILDGFGSSYSKYVLNINGHSHDYERFQPIQGVTHVTVGAPSSVEAPYSGTDPRTAFRAMHLSHMRVDVSDTGLRLQAICDASVSKEDFTCSQGSVIDEYTIGTPPVTPVKSEYYVDKTASNCSDLGPGTSAIPYCTVTKGVSRLQPGYTLYVGNGTYAETVKPAVSGTVGNPITITAWPGRSPTIGTGATYGAYLSAKSYVTISNLAIAGTVADGIYVTKSDHVVLSGNSVSGAGKPLQSQTAPGISLRASNSSKVVGNTSDHNNGHGIYVTNTSTDDLVSDNEASFNAEGWQRNANGIDVTAPGNTLLRNVVHDNEDSGLQFFTGGDNGLAALNVTYNNGDHGIDDLNVSGGRLIGNTVYHNCTSGINVEGTSTSYVVENNVAVDNAVYPAYNGIACARRAGNIGIWDSAPPTTVVDHNLVHLTKSGTMYVFKSAYTTLAAMQAATGQEANGVQGDPQFAAKGSGDLQLTEGSPAIDRGDSAVSGAQDHDVLGNVRVRDTNVDNSHATGPRLYDDLGAYEFQPDVAAAPTGPTAKLSVSPTSGAAPVQVTADASASTEPQGKTLTYGFDWGDGTSTGTQAAATASHTYNTAGTYTVKSTVTSPAGLTDTATQTVTVTTAPKAPVTALTVSPTTGTAPVQVTADGSGSTDPQGKALSYAYDWGDGATTGPQSGATAGHTYSAAGTYTVTLTTTNAAGLSSTATQNVSVTAPASAPTARLSVTPMTGTAPVQVTADASASSDPQSQSLRYAFDFGDGSAPVVQDTATAQHTYTTAGTYVAQVTVTDTAGLSDATTQTVTVDPGAAAPVAKLSVTPASGTAPVAVTADASASSDPQGRTLSYAFDFGDGSPTVVQATATATHTYTAPGSFPVSVKVTNSASLSDTAAQTVQVAATPKAPTAKLSVSPSTGTAPVQVAADASGSTDPQGQTLSYAFDFGDGTVTGPQASATANHTYTATGSFPVTVTVTDASGLTDTTTQTVTVAAPPKAPTAKLSVSPSTGTAPVQVAADASGSTDPQGQTLSYAFDFGDGTTTGAQGTATASHTYTTAGSYTVKATVTNTAGLTDTTNQPVTVKAAPGYVGQIGTASSTSTTKTASLTVANAVKAGDMVVLTTQVTTGVNKPVTVTDDVGNTYALAESQSDSTGAKTSVLYAVATKALPAGSKITASFSTATAYRLVGDELTGVSVFDKSAAAAGTASAFSSGATKNTTVANEVALGIVGLTGGARAPAWATGWTPATAFSAGTSYVGRSYRVTSSLGPVTASGTASGSWAAAVVTFRP